MPWYRVFANHGPGHQSSSEFFVHSPKKLDALGRKALWDDRFDDGRHDWPIGGVKLVRQLPAHIREAKIAGCHAAIRSNRTLLEVLKKTPVRPVVLVRYAPAVEAGKGVRQEYIARLRPSKSSHGLDVFEVGKTRDLAVRHLMRAIGGKRREYEIVTG